MRLLPILTVILHRLVTLDHNELDNMDVMKFEAFQSP